MSTEIMVALLSLAGTAIGSATGVVAAGKLTNFRLQQLEMKVDRHNHFADRIAVLEEQVRAALRRVSELEREVKL